MERATGEISVEMCENKQNDPRTNYHYPTTIIIGQRTLSKKENYLTKNT